MNPGGPTPDKPDVILAPTEPGDPISSFTNVRVADIAAFYPDAKSKGAQFLTGPLDRKAEIRCYLRDPDGTASGSVRPPACSAASTPTSMPRTASTKPIGVNTPIHEEHPILRPRLSHDEEHEPVIGS